jgi:HTH-type transcriptional regulator, transcriptional repressor of NAD biosynthesis genes
MKYQTGLIVGKFCPLHRGHQLLIDTAIAQCESVVVVSYTNPDIAGYDRIVRERWLQSLYPNVISLVVDNAWLDAFDGPRPFAQLPHDNDPEIDHRQFTAWLCHGVLGEVANAVFTSEDYGDGFAEVLTEWFCEHADTAHDVVHICVDKARQQVPISGTAIRQDPWQHGAFLSDEVRSSFVKKVVLLGGESSGKTTVCKALAERLQTVWVPEYGRDLWVEKGGQLEFEDLLHIGQQQIANEDMAMRTANRWLICDTSPLTTMFYSEALFCAVDPQLAELAARQYDCVLLCLPDFTFVQDGTRQDAAFRDRQHQWYCEQLAALGMAYTVIAGPLVDRVDQAVQLLEAPDDDRVTSSI